MPATFMMSRNLHPGVPQKYSFKVREAMKRLRKDEGGVVSYEYVIVAACMVASVVAVFRDAGAETVQGALTTGIYAIATAVAAA
jgi:Flp pilus assembly pilin Flp